jgi:hypothetical protein
MTVHDRRPAGRPRPNAADKVVYCDICGAEMLAVHCKLRCVHCGYVRDCGDP